MELNNLGRTGLKVSRLCLGCINFGGRADETESTEIIHSALSAGINFIDTANVYGHDPSNFSYGRGRSEEIVGRAIVPYYGYDGMAWVTWGPYKFRW